jgi:hypothetical protein
MSKNPIAFFLCAGNEVLEAQRLTCLFSSSFSSRPKHQLYLGGVFVYEEPTESLRRTVTFFTVRSLSNTKGDWLCEGNRYFRDE